MKYQVFVVFLCSLLSLSQEETVENTTMPGRAADESQETSGITISAVTSSLSSGEEHAKDTFLVNRTMHSRMRNLQENSIIETTTLTTVTEYDFWWFFTTPKRPFISYRDYPGKPGVASWKEISPIAGKENQKKSAKDNPTAAGVASCASWWPHLDTVVLLVLLLPWYLVCS